jgi:hypothetical protein
VELGASSLDSPRTDSSLPNPQSTSHYTIAKTMLHYQSIDVGLRCKFLRRIRRSIKILTPDQTFA